MRALQLDPVHVDRKDKHADVKQYVVDFMNTDMNSAKKDLVQT